jgi:DNA-binding beta-propeller fold protein YncE/mono/diheme cytochrome c family protein
MKRVRSLSLSILFALTVVAGCEPEPGEVAPGTHPATQRLGISADGSTLYVALADHDKVRAVDAQTWEIKGEVDVTGAPHRLTVLKDGRVAVTARHAGTLSVLDENASRVESTVEVGADPYGVIEVGDHLVVALAGQQELARVTVEDPSRVVDRIALTRGEPRGLAVDAQGKLFVSHFKGGRLSAVDLQSGIVEEEVGLEMPSNPSFEANQLDTLTTTPDGAELVVPHQECNNDPAQFGAGGTNLSGGADVEYYAMGPTGHPAVIPSVSRVDTGSRTHLSDGPGAFDVNAPEGKPESAGMAAATLNPHDRYLTRDQNVNAPVAVALADGGNIELVVNRGSGNVFVRRTAIADGENSLVAVVDLDVGITSIALSPDGKTAYVFNEFTYEVASFAVPKVETVGTQNEVSLDRHRNRDRWDPLGMRGVEEIPATSFSTADEVLPPDVVRGRFLFNAITPQMTRDGAISCASCHPGGHDDGTTWSFAEGPRQTPPLWGGLSDTMPYHWDQTLRDMNAIVGFTVMQRMGGEGLPQQDVNALQAFVDTIPSPARPLSADSSSINRGAEVFFSEGTGCATCHAGNAFTDNLAWNVGTGRGTVAGETADSFATPTLRGVARSAPYFHNGTMRTLEDLVELSVARDRMGHGSHLTAQEKADLVAFLKSL